MASADLAEVAEALTELGQPALQHIFVKQVRCQQHTQAAFLLSTLASQNTCLGSA